MHIYELRPGKDRRGLDLIWPNECCQQCHRIRDALQPDHMMPWFAFAMKLAT